MTTTTLYAKTGPITLHFEIDEPLNRTQMFLFTLAATIVNVGIVALLFWWFAASLFAVTDFGPSILPIIGMVLSGLGILASISKHTP